MLNSINKKIELQLKAGDEIAVRVDDAKKRWTTLTVPGSRSRMGDVIDGTPYINGITYDDPVQGDLGDCWWIAALSAIAHTDASALKLTENADGSHTVTLHRYEDGQFVEEPIIVAKEFRAMARSTDASETWPQIFEAAYKQWKGSFNAIAVGYPMAAFEALLGKPGHLCFFDAGDDAMASAIAAEKMPTIAVTRVKTSLTGLVEDHAYTVLGVEDGKVKLRNPWAQTEPGKDEKDDGIFLLSFDDYRAEFAYACSL